MMTVACASIFEESLCSSLLLSLMLLIKINFPGLWASLGNSLSSLVSMEAKRVQLAIFPGC